MSTLFRFFFGVALLSAGLVAILVALTEGESWGWVSGRTLGLLVGGIAVLVAWGAAELRVAEPMVDMRMLAKRPVLVTNLTAFVAGFSMFLSFVLVPVLGAAPAPVHLNRGGAERDR